MKKHLAALLGGVVIAAGISLPATAEAAITPAEVKTIPGDIYPDYVTDEPIFAGDTGFLHRRVAGSPWLWTRYADRHTTVVSALAGKGSGLLLPAGGDTVFVRGATSHQTLDLSTMTLRAVPDVGRSGDSVRVFGSSLLAIRSGQPAELYRLEADGSATPRPVLGMPEGVQSLFVVAGDGTGAVLRITSASGTRFGLLDVVSGRLGLLPPEVTSATKVMLTDDRVGVLDYDTVETFSRAGILNGTDSQPDVFNTPFGWAPIGLIGLAGRDLIVGPRDPIRDRVLRYHPDGLAPTKIVAKADPLMLQAADGVLFVGGTGPADWSVRKATASSESALLPLNMLANAGVTLSSGVLRHIEAQVRPGEASLYSHFGFELAPDSTGSAPGVTTGPLLSPLPCQTDAVCVRTVDGSAGGTSYLGMTDSWLRLKTTTGSGAGLQSVPSSSGTIVDASPEYHIVNGTSPAQQYVFQRGYNSPVVTRGVTGAGLWLSTLWSTTRAGYLRSKDLSTGTLGAEIATGSACAATEIQATANHVYWSCGRSGPSGVLVRNKNVNLPGGQYLLGDNYVVRHDADGALLRYDLTGGTLGEPATLATFARGELTDDRNISWSVDKFGGNVAWVDNDNTTHIVDPGVTPSPLTTYPDSATARIDPPSGFSRTVPLTRPVTATSLTLNQPRTGTLTTFTGGPARTVAAGGWNGMIGGKPAVRGAYQWTLSATVDGTTTKLTGGTAEVQCGGTPPLHTYDCSGQPDLLGLTSAATGAGQWLSVQPGGTALVRTGSAEQLTPITAVVPFGDITKDNRADLLIRRSDGSMRAFRGDDALPFIGNTVTAVAGNWNRWDALVHTGDLTGDGQSDLIARDRATGGLYRIDGDGAGGLKTPVLWATGYKSYTRFVGPGDINGDGKADLLLFIGTDMYAKYGDGKGGLGDRRLVGSGFLGYNAIVGAGDVNEDGKNDLLLRDTAGNLYRRLGDGKGNFGNRLLVGVGYQKFASIY